MLSLIRYVKTPLEPTLSFPSFRAVGSLTFCAHVVTSLRQWSMMIWTQLSAPESYGDVTRAPPNGLMSWPRWGI